MLEQLVESKSHAGEDAKRSGFLLTTFAIMVTILAGSWVYSLFAKEALIDEDSLSLETLVAPPIVEEAPEPEPEKQPEKQKDPNVDVREKAIANLDMTPPKIPDVISNEKSKIPPIRDTARYVLGNRNSDASNPLPPGDTGEVNTDGTGSNSGRQGQGGDDETDSGPAPPSRPKPVPKQISGGVLNGKATSLPKPPYPAAARAVRASGAVSVQVLIDESGNVVSASAVSGHPMLRAAAAQAARGARFSPTMLSGQPVKVSGVITYNFVP